MLMGRYVSKWKKTKLRRIVESRGKNLILTNNIASFVIRNNYKGDNILKILS